MVWYGRGRTLPMAGRGACKGLDQRQRKRCCQAVRALAADHAGGSPTPRPHRAERGGATACTSCCAHRGAWPATPLHACPCMLGAAAARSIRPPPPTHTPDAVIRVWLEPLCGAHAALVRQRVRVLDATRLELVHDELDALLHLLLVRVARLLDCRAGPRGASMHARTTSGGVPNGTPGGGRLAGMAGAYAPVRCGVGA